MSLIWSYIRQEVRKCSSVSTSFCGQCAHSLVLLSWVSVGSVSVNEQGPMTSLLRQLFSRFIHLSVGDGFVMKGLGIASF